MVLVCHEWVDSQSGNRWGYRQAGFSSGQYCGGSWQGVGLSHGSNGRCRLIGNCAESQRRRFEQAPRVDRPASTLRYATLISLPATQGQRSKDQKKDLYKQTCVIIKPILGDGIMV